VTLPPPPLSSYPGGPTPPPPIPVDLDTARTLWRCVVALNVIADGLAIVEGIGQRHDLAARMLDQLRQSKQPGITFTQSQVEVYVWLGLGLAAVFGLAISVLIFFAANWMRHAKHWARVMLTVFGSFQVISGLAAFGATRHGPLAIAGNVVSLVQAVLAVGAIFLMYRPDSSQYFLARRKL
jgi:hypothetical protein